MNFNNFILFFVTAVLRVLWCSVFFIENFTLNKCQWWISKPCCIFSDYLFINCFSSLTVFSFNRPILLSCLCRLMHKATEHIEVLISIRTVNKVYSCVHNRFLSHGVPLWKPFHSPNNAARRLACLSHSRQVYMLTSRLSCRDFSHLFPNNAGIVSQIKSWPIPFLSCTVFCYEWYHNLYWSKKGKFTLVHSMMAA
jgi:hypothetical protein